MRPAFDLATAELIVSRYASGETSNNLADAFGVSVNAVLRAVRKAGVPVRPTGGPGQAPKLSAEQKAEIAVRYSTGESTLQIAYAYGLAKSSVRACLRRAGVISRPMSQAKRRHSLDESVFDDPSSEGRYWIGFLLADGCIATKRGRSPEIKLGLAAKDFAHVEAFRRFVRSSHTISLDTTERENIIDGRASIRHGRVAISFTSRRLADALRSFGVIPGKTHRVCAGTLRHDSDFWRGVVDGDGSVGWHRPGLPYVSVGGTERLTQQFLDFIHLISPHCRANVYRTKSVSLCRTTGKHALRIIRLLYADCCVALPRKLDMARQILNASGQES